MLRFILVVALISVTLSDAYKTKRREHFSSEPDYRDYDEYDYPVRAKDSESGDDERPTILSYWNKLVKRTRMPSWNITNPFSKLFRPYVVKVDFPEGSDPNLDPTPRPTRNKPKKKKTPQQDYIYLNTYSNDVDQANGQYFYDPITQQYYEVQETSPEDYNPLNNFYATTFKDDDGLLIETDIEGKDEEQDHDTMHDTNYNEDGSAEDDMGKSEKSDQNAMGRFNSPALKRLKTKRLNVERSAETHYQKPIKITREITRFAVV